MRILLAGATGVIGRALLPLLLEAGHDVTPMSRRAAAALPGGVAVDALDAEAVRSAVDAAAPEVIVHQLTALPKRIDPRRMERDFELNDRLRVEGTRNLIAAAPGVPLLAQSIAFAYAPKPRGAGPHVESDPLFLDAPASFRRSARAIAELELAVGAANGVVLRYGYFHGPGTALAGDGSMAADVRRRRLPIIGDGAGVWSFIHVEDAARATLAALDRLPGPATYNIVDDFPLPTAQWLPAFAASLGAPRPLRAPEWLARALAGSYAVASMNGGAGACNELAKRQLAWSPLRQPAFGAGC